MNQKIKYITLGCKVNQYETQGMREALERSVGSSVSEQTDFVIINTCTVTAQADKENRYWIRRAKRENPAAKIVVTGCAVERNRNEIAALPDVDLIVSNHQKAEIADLLLEGCAAPAVQDLETIRKAKLRFTPLAISESDGNGRAFVKIQDGCNHACSFCKVVLVRGRSRSRGLKDILEEVIRLRDSGYREIVFAGIQLGAYGLDFDPKVNLIEVLEESSKIEGIERLRLSSIEPTDVKPDLIAALGSIPKCAPHLHIPLQSGDSEILKRMNRRYAREFYIDLIKRLKARLPGFSLTLDVMAGFPGETETHFSNTLDLIREVRPLKCHVFPYSAREGTRSASFEDEVPGAVIHARVQRLMQLADEIGYEERKPYLGRTIPVLVESIKKGPKPLLHALSANYLKVCFEGDPDRIGQLVDVTLTGILGDSFLGELIAPHKEREI